MLRCERELLEYKKGFFEGVKGDVQIHWVCWDDVCKLECFNGLGVWDLRLMNLVLLGK